MSDDIVAWVIGGIIALLIVLIPIALLALCVKIAVKALLGRDLDWIAALAVAFILFFMKPTVIVEKENQA